MTPSTADIRFKGDFEAARVPPAEFTHRAHLRLAFVYLCESNVETACARIRRALQTYLRANGVPPGKYHETLTTAWIQAVKHFMMRTPEATSFNAFLASDDRLLDTEIMLTHYRKETLFSEAARAAFVAPDRQPIPQYA